MLAFSTGVLLNSQNRQQTDRRNTKDQSGTKSRSQNLRTRTEIQEKKNIFEREKYLLTSPVMLQAGQTGWELLLCRLTRSPGGALLMVNHVHTSPACPAQQPVKGANTWMFAVTLMEETHRTSDKRNSQPSTLPLFTGFILPSTQKKKN